MIIDKVNTKELEAKKAAAKSLFARDFPVYAEKCLKIATKTKGIVPFTLNRAQLAIHQEAESQLARRGYVRIIILKARQLGSSTYVEGRFFWKVTHQKAMRAFILTHSMEATGNLFRMSERFLENLPMDMAPEVGKESAKQLEFSRLDSGFAVATAGSKGAGRSYTIHYFHGSECAHWENAADHMDGAIQAVPPAAGEIFLESTAAGIGGLFYDLCKAAERGESDYKLMFLPWFLADEYQMEPPPDWKPPPEIAVFGELHKLTPAQLYFAYKKNEDFAIAAHDPTDKICAKFRQEYPSTAAEAFNTGTDRSFISQDLVLKARKFTASVGRYEPIILGVDVARGGRAKTKVIDRQGRRAGGHVNKSYHSMDAIETGDWLARIIEEVSPEVVNIDATGVGGPVYDYLCHRGYNKNFGRLNAINFGGRATDETRYANKRAEMYDELLEWLADGLGAQIPDDDSLHVELCAAIWGPGKTRHDAQDRLIIEAKEHIWERLKVTCDDSDALALTFATHIFRHSREMKMKMEEAARKFRANHV